MIAFSSSSRARGGWGPAKSLILKAPCRSRPAATWSTTARRCISTEPRTRNASSRSGAWGRRQRFPQRRNRATGEPQRLALVATSTFALHRAFMPAAQGKVRDQGKDEKDEDARGGD